MKFPKIISLAWLLLAPGAVALFAANTNPATPNLLIINADDLGYGDVKIYGSLMGTSSAISTPRMDALAAEGMLFTAAHSCAAICSPSRYGFLTGRYSFRLQADGVLHDHIVGSYGRPIIRQGELTIAQFLKNNGYATAAFGKWHMGAQFYDRQGHAFTGNKTVITDPSQVDLSHRLEGHAIDQGFNKFFGCVGSLDGNPFAYVVDDRIQFNGAAANANSPWVMLTPSAPSEEGGGNTVGDPNLNQQNFTPDMINHVTSYLQGRQSKSVPFFAYVALYSPHLPWIPAAQFVGTTGYQYGDYVYETDYRIGQILDALGSNAANTIVIVTSDNGPQGVAFTRGLNNNHDSNGPFKGVKEDGWEAGHRIPFIVRWPGKVARGAISSALIWQGDVYATMADYLSATIPQGQAQDSVSFLPVLLGTGSSNRDFLVTASSENQLNITGAGGWKLIDGTKSGGNNTSYDADNAQITSAHGTIGGTPRQLYHLPTDIGERTNQQATQPAKVNDLLNRLNNIRNQ